jgi:site-specific DNA-methyltransferase (adenine-specific)
MDGLALLKWMTHSTANLVIFDPQYRGVLNKLKYGNEGVQRERERARLPTLNEYQIARFIEESARVLKPSGHLMLWISKYMLAEGRHIGLFRYAEDLTRVELIHWNKLRPGMGQRARSRSEYLIIAQKKPVRAKGIWTDHGIDDSWPEGADRSEHPHTKPYQMMTRLVKAVTKRGDVVVDPSAGSYLMLEVCRLNGRRFLGCDIATPT